MFARRALENGAGTVFLPGVWDVEMPLGPHSRGARGLEEGVANCSIKAQMANIWGFEGLLCLLPILLCFLLSFQKIKTILSSQATAWIWLGGRGLLTPSLDRLSVCPVQ